MTTVMDKHGGIHEWDLTLPDVEDALYVSVLMSGQIIKSWLIC